MVSLQTFESTMVLHVILGIGRANEMLVIRAVKAQTSLHIHTMLPEPFSTQIHKLQVLTDIAFTA